MKLISLTYWDNKKIARSCWTFLACLGLGMALIGGHITPKANSAGEVILWVNDIPITYDQLDHAKKRLTRGVKRDFSDVENNAIIDLLIDEELLLQRAKSLRIPAVNPNVRKAIVQASISNVTENFLLLPTSKQSLENFFKYHKAVFERPPRVAVEALLFSDLHAAEAVFQRYSDGDSWESIAISEQVNSIAMLPKSPLPAHVLRRYLGPSLANVALLLKTGELSSPIERSEGVYLLHVNTVIESSLPNFDEIAGDVRVEYLSRGREAALTEKLHELKEGSDINFNSQLIREFAVVDLDDLYEMLLVEDGELSTGFRWGLAQ